MGKFRTIDDLDCKGKRVFVRADLNVPAKGGVVSDTTRIDRFAPTVRDLAAKGARVIVASHFGRPDGKVVEAMSLRIVLDPLARAVGLPVAFADDCIGPHAKVAADALADGQVLLLENLRFHAEEEANDPAFSAALADLCDIYVDDAFSTAHRAHASTEGMARLRPNAAGRLMQAELSSLEAALGSPARPVMAIVGGSKVSTKLALLSNLLAKVNVLVIGGGMANTFLNASGKEIGKSLCEKDMADTAREIMAKAKAIGCEIILPSDAAVAQTMAENVPVSVAPVEAVPADRMILDIGPATVKAVAAKMQECKTLIWNGPVGAFEIPPFNSGTNALAVKAGALTQEGSLLSVAGGGDTVSALNKAKVDDQFSYVSTAGGAFLEWMEGKTLPGVKALETA
ncbi:phosphoglycerate kinase [Alphaproteobacteria bacterium]|nr:phosphoglycerate kinase [Alphaproteobacteria bacterium]